MLCLTKYTAKGPSSRYRLLQFQPHLEAAGIEVDIRPLHDDDYLDRRFSGRRASRTYLLRKMLARLAVLTTARRYDIVFIQKEIFPWVPGVVEAALEAVRVPMVVDFDDAIFLLYRNHRWLARKIDRVIARCDLVLAGNRYLADYARRFNQHTILFPTVVDTSRFTPADRDVPDTPVVGWIGSPETVGYLRDIAPTLDELRERADFELLVVGAENPGTQRVSWRSHAWSEADEADDLRAMDVGIMPLPDGDWSRGKCSLKLLQYMSTGIPTVSSPRGSAPDIVTDGVDGMLAETPHEWRARLETLFTSADLRATMGRSARARVEDAFSLSRHGPELAGFLREVVARRRGRR
jgi:glycosyltransferase involved in cell wall biosynthesis